MKKGLCLACLLVVLIALSAYAADDAHFSVQIEQNGSIIPPHSGIVRLARVPFSFVLTFSRPMGVLVAASFDSTRYDLAKDDTSVEIFMEPGSGAAEGYFNRDRMIFVGETHTNAWYYTNEIDHRFDRVQKTEAGIVCRRTVRYINDIDNEQLYPVYDMNESRIYLVFVNAVYDWDIGTYREYQRETLILEFDDSRG